MSPFPGWKVIPDGWAEHHRPVAEDTMQTPATVFRVTAGPAPYPKPANWSPLTAIWMTSVRVQSLTNQAAEAHAGEQEVTVRRYLVTAPVGGPALKVGDQVHTLGRRLRIVDMLPGTYLWELDLTCEENLTQAGAVEVVPSAD